MNYIGQVSLEIFPIFGSKKFSLRLGEAKVLEFKPNQADIDSGRIKPEAITKYFDFLTQWLGDAINLALNRKVLTLSYKNIQAVPQGKVLKPYSYFL